MTRLTIPAAAVALFAFASPAGAGEGWVLSVEAVGGTGTRKAEILLDADHLRAREIGYDQEIVITREAITILDHGRRSYARLSLDMLERMLGGLVRLVRGMKSDQIEELREAMKDLPPEPARRIEEEIARIQERSLPAGRYRLEETGETGEVAGLPARKYRVTEAGRDTGEAWFTDRLPSDMVREVYGRLRGILPPEVKEQSVFYEILEDLPGFPVRLVGRAGDGVTERVEVTGVRRRDTSPRDFEPEPDYRQEGLVDLDSGSGSGEGGR